jgi:hypothetical protein
MVAFYKGAKTMVIFINRSGEEIEVNETPANINAAHNAGWKLKGKPTPSAKKKAK